MNDKKKIRVMLVDDHAVVRSGLSDFLLAYDDLELAGEASSGEDAVLMCGSVKPHVVLMDLVMEGMDGAEATSAIRKAAGGSTSGTGTTTSSVGGCRSAACRWMR